MKTQILLVILWLSESYCHPYESNQYALNEEYYWGTQDFQFPNTTARTVALATGSYIPANNNIYAIRAWEDKIFVSVFRLKLGIASSFNYFSTIGATKSPVLIPYPSYDANYVSEDPLRPTVSLTSQSSIINAAYFTIDRCDRLWIPDTGHVDFFGTRRVVAQPAIVIFDLKTDTLIRRFPIPAEYANSLNGFVNLDVDFNGKDCDDAYAYVADIFRSIVVYSFKNNRAWRLTHNYLGSDPLAGNLYYEGVNYNYNFGIVGVTIGEHHRDGSKRVYLKPYASTKTFYISNKVLQNEAYIAQNNYYFDVNILGDRGKSGYIYEYAYDGKTNVLFDAQFYKGRIGCWNTANPYQNSSFGVVFKTSPSFFPDDISIDRNRNLWVLSNNFPLYVSGVWNSTAKNVRIFKAKVDDAISGTVCKRKNKKSKPYHNYGK